MGGSNLGACAPQSGVLTNQICNLAVSPAALRRPCAEARGSWRCSLASRRSRGKRTTLPRLRSGIDCPGPPGRGATSARAARPGCVCQQLRHPGVPDYADSEEFADDVVSARCRVSSTRAANAATWRVMHVW